MREIPEKVDLIFYSGVMTTQTLLPADCNDELMACVAPEFSITAFTPLSALLAEYRKKREDIQRIASYVRGELGVMSYFMNGARVEHSYTSFTAETLFDEAPALRCLDATFWGRAMALTDVLDAMPAEKRNQWVKQIQKHETPAFEPSTVEATLRDLLARRAEYFGERVEGLFRALSGDHVTNQPQGYSKRFILNYVLDSYGHVSSERANYIHDLRAVIARFVGRDAPPAYQTYRDLDALRSARQFGEWVAFDGNAFRAKLFMKGTLHLEVSPSISYRLNQVLAWRNPYAIPPEFRQKPAKPTKDFILDHDLLSFGTLAALSSGRVDNDGRSIWFSTPVGMDVQRVLAYLGGVLEGSGRVLPRWNFDYPIAPVLTELQRTGRLPEQRSHQFWPTEPDMAQELVAMAQITDEDRCLEPSAGQGGIAQFMPTDRTVCVEISPLHAAVLKARGFTTHVADFLSWVPEHKFSVICMNPPFSDNRAISHVKQAASLLLRGGRLVSVLPASIKGRLLMDGWEHSYSEVRCNEFKGTGVSVVLLRLTAPRTTMGVAA